jgi:hypothetical protein
MDVAWHLMQLKGSRELTRELDPESTREWSTQWVCLGVLNTHMPILK